MSRFGIPDAEAELALTAGDAAASFTDTEKD